MQTSRRPSEAPSAARVPWQAELVLLSSIWGLSFLFIKIADQALTPLQVALGRAAFGAATLLALLYLRRERLPLDRALWARLAIAGILFNAVPFTLFAYAETLVSSVLAGIWNATTPLFTMLVALAVLPEERPTTWRVAGLGLGFAGVLVILGVWHGLGGGQLAGSLACLGAAACYGAGFVFARRQLGARPESAVAISAGTVVCGCVELAIVAPLLGGGLHAPPLPVVASVAALGSLGTGLAYVLNYRVVRAAGATAASTVTYLIPIFATAAGLVFLGERLEWNEPLGALLVVAGIALSQLSHARA